MNLVDVLRLRATAGMWQDKMAYVEEGRKASLTHVEVLACAEHLAEVLIQGGVQSHETVGLLVGDRLEWPIAFLACARIGAMAVLMNPEAAPSTLDELCRLGQVSSLLTWSGDSVLLKSRDSPGSRAVWRISDALGNEDVNPASLPKPKTATEAQDIDNVPLYLQFSSGTTGLPKGVVHRSIDLPVYYRTVGAKALGLESSDVLYSVSQFYFTYGFNNQFVYPMFSGCSAVLNPERRSAARVAEGVQQYGVTILFSVPSNLAHVPSLDEADGLRRDSLRAVVSAGERLPAYVERRVTEALGAPVLEQIGCTEHGNAICANGIQAYSPFSCGFPCEGVEVEVRDAKIPEAARAASPDGRTVGDLWVRGATIPPTAYTSEGIINLLDEEGWLRTGDMAYWNDDDALAVVGRADDILMNGGISVPAIRVEQCIRMSGVVNDSAVTSLVDPSGKSYLVALVVLDAGMTRPMDELEPELMAHCRDRLDRYCVPKRFLAVEAVPRTPSGKIRRHLVAAKAEGLLGSIDKKFARQ